MIESSLYDYLSAQSTITDITSTRIYPHLMPQGGSLPALTYRVVSRPHEHHIGGAAGAARARIQIDSWASTLIQAETLADAVRLVLQGFSGDLNGTYVGSCWLENEVCLSEMDEGSEYATYHVASDYVFFYREEIS